MLKEADPSATAEDTFLALHDFVWHCDGMRDTTDLASWFATPQPGPGWRGSVIYVTRFRPSLENTHSSNLSSRGSIDPGTLLTLAQGWSAASAMLRAHNALSPTEVWWFQEYLNSDPAAWGDWMTAVEQTLEA